MTNQFSIMVLTFLLSFSAFSFERYDVVSQVDGDSILAVDVENYIESFYITPGIEAILRQKAIEEGSDYEDEKKKLISHTFKPVASKITLIRLLQKNALLNNKRQFFNLTKVELDKIVDEQIKAISRSINREQKIDVDPKKEIIEQLKVTQFKGLNLTDNEVWQLFTRKIRYNITERYREKEIVKFLCSLGDCQKEDTSKILKRLSNRLKRNHFVSLSFNEEKTRSNQGAIDYLLNESQELDAREDSVDSKENRPKRFLFLGEIISNRVEFRHINDWDLTSGLAPMLLGYPKTDDQGRTSGLNLSFDARGTHGTLSIELENFLFSRKISSQGHLTSQEIEEDTSLRVVSRQFLDQSGKKWILLGISAGHRTQTAGVHSFIQSAFHTLNPTTSDREYLDRDQSQLFIQGIIGVGGKYSIIDSKHVDLIIGGEAFINPTVGFIQRSSFTVRSTIDLNFSGSYEDYPLLSIGLFGEYSFLINGSQESVVGGKISIGKVYRSIYYQASLFVVKWDRDLDRMYEGGASWTTGISISATFINKRPKVEYVIN